MGKNTSYNPTYEIIKGKEEDLEDIVKLWVEIIEWHANIDSNFKLDIEGKENFTTMLRNAFNDLSQVVYVAKEKDKLIGFLYGYIKNLSGFFKHRIVAHISDVAVLIEHRRKGVGTALINKFQDEIAIKFKATDITLYVHVNNTDAIDFYHNLGFYDRLLTMERKTE